MEKARELGFDACRVVAPDAIPDAPARLARWLDAGAHGDMDWMAETAERRADPRALWPQTRSIVMLGMNYGPDENPLDAPPDRGAAQLSVYARNRDYHEVMKGRLKMLAQWLVKEGSAAQTHAQEAADVKVFVDTAPVMEKPLAAAAGLGWQGKHTNLVSRDFGSWLFLGSIFTTLPIAPDAAEIDHCGSCRACLDACPTKAFPAPYQIDARRCVSYLTIEHKGQIPLEFREAIGVRVYGCDDCLAVCPWNKFAQNAREAKLQARDELKSPRLADLVALDDAGFRALFSGGPIKRIGHARFLRNVLLAIGNAGDPSLAPLVLARLDDPSPLARGMAVWAARRLLPAADFAALRTDRAAAEADPQVRAEWSDDPERAAP